MRSVPSRNPDQRLQDIIDNIEAVREFIADLDFESFVLDRKTCYAVVRALGIISEASRRLPADLKAKLESIDWQSIAAAGNIYRHEYEAVILGLVWHTATQELHPLELVAREELARIDQAK
jgi:uncharacterized protein with HEPN domain